jgi:hypothetical protein
LGKTLYLVKSGGADEILKTKLGGGEEKRKGSIKYFKSKGKGAYVTESLPNG